MIQGRSSLVYRIKNTHTYVSHNLKDQHDVDTIHVDVSFVDQYKFDSEAVKHSRKEHEDVELMLEDGKYICGSEVEKMSKSLLNVVNPDPLIEKYGADTFRMSEMFLGPLEQFKPWNTNGIEGVFKFLRKFWNLFFDEQSNWNVSDDDPTVDELKIMNKTIKKVSDDIERYSFNTAVSAFMICTNELSSIKCNKKEVLSPLVLALSPFAPHVCEELWSKLENQTSVSRESYPTYEEKYILDDSYEYPISINGKLRLKMTFSLDTPLKDIENQVLASEVVQKWIEGNSPKKVIIVPNKIVNIVI